MDFFRAEKLHDGLAVLHVLKGKKVFKLSFKENLLFKRFFTHVIILLFVQFAFFKVFGAILDCFFTLIDFLRGFRCPSLEVPSPIQCKCAHIAD